MSEIHVKPKEEIVIRGQLKPAFLGKDITITIERNKMGGYSVIGFPEGHFREVYVEGVTDFCESWRKMTKVKSELATPVTHSTTTKHPRMQPTIVIGKGARKPEEEVFG